MRLPRVLLVALAFALALPWLTLEAARSIVPGAQGPLIEEAKIRGTSFGRRKAYRAPRNLGEQRLLHMPRFGVFGDQITRTYYTLGAQSPHERPVIILLHGAGRDGRAMLDMWKGVLDDHDFILIAPNSERAQGWNLIEDAAFVSTNLLEDAARFYPIDRNRVYLAGHSMGGKFALRLANLGIGDWEAVSVHAASLWRNSIWPSKNRIPVQMFFGDDDRVFTPNSVRSTAKRLSQAGHSVRLIEVSNHTHWYYSIAPQLALRSIAFFR